MHVVCACWGITSEYVYRSQKSLSGIFNHSPLFSFRDSFALWCWLAWNSQGKPRWPEFSKSHLPCLLSAGITGMCHQMAHLIFEVGSYWAHWLARLAGQPAPGILLFLPPQRCNQHAHKPHLVFMWDLPASTLLCAYDKAVSSSCHTCCLLPCLPARKDFSSGAISLNKLFLL